NRTLAGPAGIGVDGSGNLYVAVPADNRILVFPTSGTSGAPASTVLGQTSFTSTQVNAGAFPRASAGTFSGPADVKLDAAGNLYVADSGNNRVLGFQGSSKSARQVWGQIDFATNGVNQVKASGLNAAQKVVVDYSEAPFALFVADTANHRVLGWRD